MLIKIFTLAIGASLLCAPLTLADDDQRSTSRVVFIGGDGGQATVTLDHGNVQVVAVDDHDVAVHEFDFSQLGALIDGAVSAAMANLDDAFDEELTIVVDDDRMLHVSHGDQACAVNMDVLVHELRNTLANVHVDLARELHDVPRIHHRHEQDDTDELKAELDDLKAELKQLRRELDRVR